MFYKLLGMLTWKAIRFYVATKVPKKVVAAGLVVLGLGALSAIATASARRGASE